MMHHLDRDRYHIKENRENKTKIRRQKYVGIYMYPSLVEQGSPYGYCSPSKMEEIRERLKILKRNDGRPP